MAEAQNLPSPPPPPLSEEMKLAWLKRDFGRLTLDAVHDGLQSLPVSTTEELAAFRGHLAVYAGYAQCVATLNHQLAQLNGGQPFTEDAMVTHFPDLVADEALAAQANRQIESEVARVVEDWRGVFRASSPWVQRIQPTSPSREEGR